MEKLEITIYEEEWEKEKPETPSVECIKFIYKYQGNIWTFHRKDLDYWPSRPHGHNYPKREKLDIYTGVKYKVSNKKQTGKLKKASLKSIQVKLDNANFFTKSQLKKTLI